MLLHAEMRISEAREMSREILQWRHNERNGDSNHRCSFVGSGEDKKKTSKLRVTGLCAGNSPMTGDPKKASNAKNVSTWWHHHECIFSHMISCGSVIRILDSA